MEYYAGIDIGATHIRAIVGNREDGILGSYDTDTPQGPTGIAVTEAVLDAVRAAVDEAGVEPERIRATGIGSIGPLDLADGTVRNTPNLPDTIERIPLVGPVEKLIDGGRVYLHNDTAAGVIGQRFYSDRTPEDMVYLTISTGIGAGVCVDGNVLSGWDGNAGEVGHLPLDPDERMQCGCGKYGHWEAYCSGTNIPDYARTLARIESALDRTDLPLDDPGFSAADVFARAGEDAFADRVIGRIGRWNGLGITSIVHAYAPIVVYVGGAVALNNPDLVLDPIRDRIDELVMTNVPDVELTTLGADIVVRGALASAMTAGTGDPDQGFR